MFGVAILSLLLAMYFLPTIIAYRRRDRHVFAIFLVVQIAAIIAVQGMNGSQKSQAHDAIRRDRGASAIWDSAN